MQFVHLDYMRMNTIQFVCDLFLKTTNYANFQLKKTKNN
jgi:hypothetical protein